MKTLILALALLFTTTAAHADFGILGGFSKYNTSNNTGADTSASSGFLGGFAFSSGMMIGPTLEIDVLFDNRKQSNALYTATLPEIQIPAILRFPVVPELLNIGAGAYYGIGVGSVTTDLGTSSSYSAAGLNSSDFGVLGSAAITLPVPGLFKVVADARYLFGLTNESSLAGQTLHTREFDLLLGIIITI